MKKLFTLLLLVTMASATVWAGGAKETEEPADKVLTNAVVYTVNEDNPWAEAVAVSGDRIVYVGDAAGAEAYIGDDTDVMDMEGRLVMPAFVDGHMHPAMSAYSYLYEIPLFDAYSVEEYVEIIAGFAADHPELEALGGGGYNRAMFDVVGPRKEILDDIDSERPIVLTSVDGHSCWVNSKALELAGITKDTPDPEGGSSRRIPKPENPPGCSRNPPWAWLTL